MSILSFTDGKFYVDGFDLSGNLNQIDLSLGARMLDGTTFGLGTEVNTPGLKRAQASCRGFWEANGASKPDDVLFANVGVIDKVASIWALGNLEGDKGYAFQTVQASYKPGAQVGELLAFDAEFAARGLLIRPSLMGTGNKTVTGNGAGQQLGLVGAAQKLYAFLQVFAAGGTLPTLDVVIESDDNAPFGSPTTRITFTQMTARGAQWAAPVVGPIAADDRWRAKWTIGGSAGPNFTFVVGLAIL